MNVIYKTKIFSGDGQTFLRPFLLHIPICSIVGNANAGGYMNPTGQNAGEFSAAYQAYQWAYIRWDQNTTFLTGGGAWSAFYGWNNVVGLMEFFGGTPTVNSAIRIVFNNGSYIKITVTAVYSASDRKQVECKFQYYLANDSLVGTVYMRPYLDISGTSYNSYCNIFPFAYPDSNGNYSDTHLRCFEGTYYVSGVGQYGINSRLITKYNSNTEIANSQCSINSGDPVITIFTQIDLSNFLSGIIPVDQDDPYQDIEDSQPSGPAEGSGIPDSAGIDVPDLPSVSVTDTGFLSLFVCGLSDIKALADYMWSSSFDLDTLRKLFANPMDCIIGLNLLPVPVSYGTAKFVKVGNLYTSVELNPATSQWVSKSMGSLVIDKPYGNYLDHAPYTKCQLYLPYIGTVPISIDDIMGKTVTLTYHVDILTCACIAFLEADGDVLYQFSGTCGYSIPVSGDDYRQVVSSVISLAATAGGALISGGMAAPAAAGTMTAKQAARAAAKQAAAKVADQSLALSTGASMASNVMNAKPTIERSGAIGGSSGIMGVQRAYFIFEMPDACKPAKQYHYLGYPGFITTTVGDLSGYAEFESIILDGIACTEEERGMIEALCAGGIYV